MGIRRATLVRVVLLVLSAAVAAGCSSGRSGGDDEPALPSGESAASRPVEALALGRSVEVAGTRTTVTAARRPFGDAARPPQATGQEWLAVRAETCAGDAPVETGWYLFAAHGPSAERYPASDWDSPTWPRPQYPHTTLDPRECTDGWIAIPVVTGAPVVTVRLSDPQGIPLAEWWLREEVGG